MFFQPIYNLYYPNSELEQYLNGTLSVLDNSYLTSINYSIFANMSMLEEVNLTNCQTIEQHAFENCSQLTKINLPKCTSINDSAFANCVNLVDVSIPLLGTLKGFINTGIRSLYAPECSIIRSNAIADCAQLTTLVLPKLKEVTFAETVFRGCTNLQSIYLYGSECVSLNVLVNTNVFSTTKIGTGQGYVYVPSSLLSTYQTAAIWSYISTQFIGV